jgi:hypothetical protein
VPFKRGLDYQLFTFIGRFSAPLESTQDARFARSALRNANVLNAAQDPAGHCNGFSPIVFHMAG